MSDYNPQDQSNQAPPQGFAPPPPAAADNKGKAIAALVLGIAALVLAWWGWLSIAGIAVAIVGLVLAIGVRKENNPATKGLATGGLICAVIALVISGITLVACTLCAAAGAAVVSEAGVLEEWQAALEGLNP
ncbi:MAG: hypothetical protein FWF60_03315 [Oscillospiraceae bacterium]|nr:hypothetical protein [Oscillospiraceae bacterium]